MSKPFTAVRVFRLCRRCGRFRRVGNFTHSIHGSRHYAGTICRRCIPASNPFSGKLTRRAGWVLTDKARAFLVAERAAA